MPARSTQTIMFGHFGEVACDCGNNDQERLVVEKEVIDFVCRDGYRRDPVFRWIGWRCLDCQTVIRFVNP